MKIKYEEVKIKKIFEDYVRRNDPKANVLSYDFYFDPFKNVVVFKYNMVDFDDESQHPKYQQKNLKKK